MKRRRDPLLYLGVLYLVALLLFAAVWPAMRSWQLGNALQDPVDSVYRVVSNPHQPPGTQLAGIDRDVLRADPRGAILTDADPDTSAAQSGIPAGAVITAVDGQSLEGKPFPEVVSLLGRSQNAQVAFSIVSDGNLVAKTAVWHRSGKPSVPPIASLPLGTDEQGRDILARLAQGARISLLVGLLVQVIALSVGITMGVLGVFAPRWIADPLMRFTDGMFAFPDILLAILIIGVWEGPRLLPVIVALAITSWPSVTRLVRTQCATLKDREFVIAAKATGASTFYQVTRHILPQIWGILMAISMIDIAGTILAESTLSFLGIGVQAPDPSWGAMINNARVDMNSHPLLLVWPCAILSVTIFALNFVGDGVRALMDPKSR